jgi:cell division septum initiation protein DivIVA
MGIEGIIDKIEDLLEDAWHLPVSGGKIVVSSENFKRLLEDLRRNLPKEIMQAKKIVADRNQIIEDTKNEAKSMAKIFQEKAKSLVNRDEIVKNAQNTAKEIIFDANQKSKDIKVAAAKYTEKLLKDVENFLNNNLLEIKKVKQSLRSNLE